jgi:hypothetical protein
MRSGGRPAPADARPDGAERATAAITAMAPIDRRENVER